MLDELLGRWRDDLGAWAIPEDITSSVTESPWVLPGRCSADGHAAADRDGRRVKQLLQARPGPAPITTTSYPELGQLSAHPEGTAGYRLLASSQNAVPVPAP